MSTLAWIPNSVKQLQVVVQLASFPEPGVILMALSPAGDFLVTCTKPGKAADTGEPVKNLKVIK
jgi:hypothetical protein